jgi:TonB family protein
MNSHTHRHLFRRFACVTALAALLPLALPSQETEIKPVKKILPAYPDVLKHAGISGTVRVRATIGPDGTVKDVAPLGGGAVFIDAVIKAVKQWRFAPTGEHQRFAEISVSFECCNTVTTTP